ncbi:hypothetical protein [Nocardia nova]|uniref:hypothetical protein n=1 Tax=Nocardia nova TaxID=37330 RepID=UPI0033C2CF61
MFIVGRLTESMNIRIPVALAFFPGWLPIGACVGMMIYLHAQTFTLIRPITEYTEVTIRAHPRFVDAVESRSASTEIHEW